MTPERFNALVDELVFICDMNQRYHQHIQRQCWAWDKAVKIAVAALAIGALVSAIIGEPARTFDIGLAACAAVVAIVLNVIPVGEWEREYAEMFRSWSDLRFCAEQLRLKQSEAETVSECSSERLAELIGRRHSLSAHESLPNRALLIRCQEDVNESLWGQGIRTEAQVNAERKRRDAANSSSVAVAGSAPATGANAADSSTSDGDRA